MLDSGLSQNSATAVRQPVFEIGFGGDGLMDMGLGGEDPWQRSTASLTVDTALAPFVDTAVIVMSADGQSPDAAVDDEGAIALGYADDEAVTVFSAVIDQVASSLHGFSRISAVNGGAALAGLRINQSYEQQTAGDIVNDLAGQAGVDTDTVESGVELPFYVIDDRWNAYQHIARLAGQSGFCAYFTVDNGLYFGPLAEGSTLQTFHYGEDILALQVQTTGAPDGIVVVGQGAAGSQGEEAWAWLVKDPSPVRAEAGQGAVQAVLSDAALRSAEAVRSAADGRSAAIGAAAVTGRIAVPGAPRITVGGTIEIVDVPQAEANGACLVQRVRHRFSKRDGYLTILDICKPAGTNGSGGMP
jgi:phage protein D